MTGGSARVCCSSVAERWCCYGNEWGQKTQPVVSQLTVSPVWDANRNHQNTYGSVMKSLFGPRLTPLPPPLPPHIIWLQWPAPWLIINHLGNTWWCKIHNVNIMLRTIFKHSVGPLQLPVSMYFAFIYQLKMHLVWIWKYYAKLHCSCKQIMVLGDSVVLNE